MSEVLKMIELTKRYSTFTLGPLNYQIQKGTAVALIGPNGSGKSTFLKLLINVLKPSAGTIELFDQLVTEEDSNIKQQIGYVGDYLAPFGDLKVNKMSTFISYWYPNWNHKRYKELISRYEINERQVFNKCSKGTQKKIEFVFSLSYEPKLLLLDEPTSGVDLISQRKMREDLRCFMENEENSLLLSTHILDDVSHICDYICLMDKGRIIRTFEKDEIQDQWARLWIDHLPERMKNNPAILRIIPSPLHIITNDALRIEQELSNEAVSISHSQKMGIDEALEYMIHDLQRN